MKSYKLTAIIFSLILTTGIAYAFSNCMQKYASHPRAIPAQKNNCGICHKNANGSGPQNTFGRAFADGGFTITNMLVADFPELFLPDETIEDDEPEDNNTNDSGTPAQSPKIKRIKPKKAKINVLLTIKVLGKNFEEKSTILIDEVEADTTFQSSMVLKANVTLEEVGAHKVQVKNSDESKSNEIILQAKEPKKKKK